MILDSLENTGRFETLHPLFRQSFDYFRSMNLSKMEDGDYTYGEHYEMRLTISSFKGKNKSDAIIETHRKYLDIQIPLIGIEKIGWKPLDQLAETTVDYDEKKDIAFYVDRPTAFTKIYPGQFAIYFPEDGHAPGIGQGFIRKAIIKIPIEVVKDR